MGRVSSSAARVAYVAETTEDTIPTDPAWQLMRVTTEGLRIIREGQESQELEPSRNIKNWRVTSGRVEGSFGFEFTDGDLEAIMEGALFGAFSTDVLKNGTTRKTFSMETRHDAGGGSYIYRRGSGLYISKFALDLKQGEIAKGSFDVLGQTGVYSDAVVSGTPTYTAAGTEEPIVAQDITISSPDSSLLIDCVTSLTLEVDNNLRVHQCLGSIHPTGVGLGDCKVTGTIEMYLDDALYDNYALFTDNTVAKLRILLNGGTNKKTQIDLSSIKLTELDDTTGAKNSDVMMKLGFQAIYNASDAATIKVTRNVA